MTVTIWHNPRCSKSRQTLALLEARGIAPADGWIGRIIDPFGNPLDGKPLLRGGRARRLRNPPPEPANRTAGPSLR